MQIYTFYNNQSIALQFSNFYAIVIINLIEILR